MVVRWWDAPLGSTERLSGALEHIALADRQDPDAVGVLPTIAKLALGQPVDPGEVASIELLAMQKIDPV
jgi:hypothetical protein